MALGNEGMDRYLQGQKRRRRSHGNAIPQPANPERVLDIVGLAALFE